MTLVVNKIEATGFWLQYNAETYWIAFDEYPIFRYGTDEEIQNVRLVGDGDFYWPALDADFDVQRLIHPECYPLRARHPREMGNHPRYR